MISISDYFHIIKEAQQVAFNRNDKAGAERCYFEISDKMLREIMMLGNQERERVVESIGYIEAGFLLGLVMAAAIWSIRNSDPRRLQFGMLALIIENQRTDYRETLVRLSLLNNSAEKLGASLKSIYDNLSWTGTISMQSRINGFFAEGCKNISEMGYMEALDDCGNFTYQRTW